MDNHYKGVIWTNHALDRLRERGIKQGDAWATWNHAEQTRKGSAPGSWVYYRTYPVAGGAGGHERIEVVAKQNEKKEWLILSVWSRPVVGKQNYTSSQKTSLWKNLIKIFFNK